MMDLPHDTAPPKPTLLSEYRPPDFVIDQVELSFVLGEDKTIVRSHLTVRRSPAAGTPPGEQKPSLRLAGEELELLSIALDGAALPPDRYQIEDGDLIIAEPPDAFRLEITVRIKTPAQHRAQRPLHLRRQFLYPMRSRGVPPHHLVPRPA